MKIRMLSALAVSLCACDEPEFSAGPGVEVCQMMVDECGPLCDTEPEDESDRAEFRCSHSTNDDFSGCIDDVADREDLQEAHDGPTPGNAAAAAYGVVIGYNPSCEVTLGTLPVFCYGCK